MDYYERKWQEMSDDDRAETAAGHLESESWDPDAKFVLDLWAEVKRLRATLSETQATDA